MLATQNNNRAKSAKANLPDLEGKQSRDQLGEMFGVSGRLVDDANYVNVTALKNYFS